MFCVEQANGLATSAGYSMPMPFVWKYSQRSFLKTMLQTTLTSVSWNCHCSSICRIRATQSHHLLISAVAKRGSFCRQSGRSSRGVTRVGQKHRCRCGGHNAGNQKGTERTHDLQSFLNLLFASRCSWWDQSSYGCDLCCYLMVMILLRLTACWLWRRRDLSPRENREHVITEARKPGYCAGHVNGSKPDHLLKDIRRS